MSNSKRDVKAKENSTASEGLSLRGSHINLSTRLSSFNVPNPLHYLYNDNIHAPLHGRPMSASTLGITHQESPLRRSKMQVKRPQSADTINKIVNNRHILFDFNNQKNNTNSGNRCTDLESVFDEMDAVERQSSDGCSTPVRFDEDDRDEEYHNEDDHNEDGRNEDDHNEDGHKEDDDDRWEPRGGADGGAGPSLEHGLASKPPVPPAGRAQQPRVERAAVTFDDAVELKFQRWFPNSASHVVTVPASSSSSLPPPPSPLNGVSYEYSSERVIDCDDRGAVSCTYTRSSSSMSVRRDQQQLDEENLYSNLNAAIGGGRADKLKASVSVDLLDALRDEDDRRPPRAAKFKKRTKKTALAAAAAVHKAKNDVTPLKQSWEAK